MGVVNRLLLAEHLILCRLVFRNGDVVRVVKLFLALELLLQGDQLVLLNRQGPLRNGQLLFNLLDLAFRGGLLRGGIDVVVRDLPIERRDTVVVLVLGLG